MNWLKNLNKEVIGHEHAIPKLNLEINAAKEMVAQISVHLNIHTLRLRFKTKNLIVPCNELCAAPQEITDPCRPYVSWK